MSDTLSVSVNKSLGQITVTATLSMATDIMQCAAIAKSTPMDANDVTDYHALALSILQKTCYRRVHQILYNASAALDQPGLFAPAALAGDDPTQ